MAEEGDGDTSRAKYVQRIFEISGMVGKQNEQIRKVGDLDGVRDDHLLAKIQTKG